MVGATSSCEGEDPVTDERSPLLVDKDLVAQSIPEIASVPSLTEQLPIPPPLDQIGVDTQAIATCDFRFLFLGAR